MDNRSVYNYKDIIYSCFQPTETLIECRLPHHALIYVYSGEIHIDDNGINSTINAGQYVFLKKDIKLKIHKRPANSTPYKAISIRFDRKFLREYIREVAKTNLPKGVKSFKEAVIPIDDSPYIESLFASLFPFTDRNILPDEEFVNLKMREALKYILQTNPKFYPTLFDFSNPWKIDLLEFMERNFTQDLSIEEFAGYSGRSLASFKRDFSLLSELPPQKWLIKKRLEMAYTLLVSGDTTISDIYLQVGFKNRSHFVNAFKNHYGYPPSKLQQKIG